jgi:MFS transporter, putative metabolite:H+ symporter
VSSGAVRELGTKIDALKKIPLRAGVIFAISLSGFFAFYDITNYAYIAPVLKGAWSVGDDQIAIGASTTVLGYVIGAFAITIFADSRGRKPALIVSTLILGVGSFLASFSQDMIQMSIFRLFTGIGIGSEIAISSAYIGELSPKSKRGRYTSIVIGLGWVGLASSGPISLILIQQGQVFIAAGIDGWRIVMAIPGIAALFCLLLRIHMPESPRWLLSKYRITETNSVLKSLNIAPLDERGGEPYAMATERQNFAWQPFKDRTTASRLVLLTTVWFAVFVPVYASLLLVVEYVNQGYSLTESITINIVSGIGFVIGGILSVVISERIERKYQISIAAVIMGSGFVLRGLFVNDYVGLVAAGFIAFTANSWLVSNLYTYTAESFPTKIRSFGFGAVEGTSRALSSIGPIIFVFLRPYGFMNVMIVISLFCFVASILVLGGRHTRSQSLENLNKE